MRAIRRHIETYASRRHIETCASGGEQRNENGDLLVKSKAFFGFMYFFKLSFNGVSCLMLCFRKDACGNRVLVILCFHKDACENRVLFLVFDNRGQKR